jgi:hypothetical protein
MLILLHIIHKDKDKQSVLTKSLVDYLTKLANEKKIDLDQHMFTFLFSYRTTYKVAIGYTPYQLVYG